MCKYLLVLYIALQCICTQLQAQTGLFVPELSTIDVEVARFMQQWNLPGGSVALVKDGRLVYARGFGEADINTPVTPDHLFRIASLSKPVTSLAIMKLIQDGRLKADDLVFGEKGVLNNSEYKRIKDERIKSITVRHLLQHTAGWDRETNPDGDPMFNSTQIAREMQVKAPANQIAIIQYVLSQPLDFTPGSQYAYSNIGYCILGRVIEKITGLKYDEYMYQEILSPQGITEMRLAGNLYIQKQSKEVRYYDRPGKSLVTSVCEKGKKVSCPYGGFNVEAMDAHGGWIASATDLARLLVAVDGSATRPDFLHPQTLRLMAQPCKQNVNYAMGWFVNGSGNWWHTGSLAGSSAIMAKVQNGYTWVVLFNGNPQSDAYFAGLDRLMWRATDKVNVWPTHDLFNPATVAQRIAQ